MIRALLIFLTFALAATVAAQPTVSSTIPDTNSTGIGRSSNVSVTFSQAVLPLNGTSARIHGALSGSRSATYSSSSSATQLINPTNDFLAGERVRLHLSTDVKNASSVSMNSPYVLEFTAAAATGPAHFVDEQSSFGSSLAATFGMALGDIDGDGDVDIVQGANNGQNNIILNNGSQVFTIGTNFGSGSDATVSIALADFDNDGHLDALVGNLNGQNVLYENTGGGSFGNTVNVGSNNSATTAVAAADVNGDGWVDAIIGNFNSQSEIFINDGTGGFIATTRLFGPSSGSLVSGLAVGDVDEDGDLDIFAVAQGTVAAVSQDYIYYNTNGFFTNSDLLGNGSENSSSIAVGDIDGDGDLDAIVGTKGSGDNLLYLYNGTTSAPTKSTFSAGETTQSLALADVDGDGDLDIIESNFPNSNHIYLNNGSGTFNTTRDFGAASETSGVVAAADFDGDNDIDIAVGDSQSTQLSTSKSRVYFNAVGSSTLSLTSTSSSVEEHSGNITISVTRTGSTTGSASVNYVTSDGTATSGSDYTAASGTLNWAAAEGGTKTFSVSITDDSSAESNETFTVTLSGATGFGSIGTDTQTITIVDNDTTPTVSVASSSVTTAETVGTLSLDVELDRPFSSSVSVSYATADSTATAGSDYTQVSGSLTFSANETLKTIAIPISDDSIAETDETFSLTISNASGANLSAIDTTTVTIADDDQGSAEFAFSASSYSIGEGSASVTITVDLGQAPGVGITQTIDYATSSGTASAGDDYTSASGTLSFSGSETSKTFTVSILSDTLDENDETIQLALTNATGGAAVGTPASATITIQDDDASPTIELDDASLSVAESGTTVTLNLTTSEISGRNLSVDWTATDNTTSAGDDYTPTSGTAVVTAGSTTTTITITITDDTLDEVDETFGVALSNPVSVTLGSQTGTTITITDNDAPPSVAMQAAAQSAAEDVGTTVITVELSTASGRDVDVDYSTNAGTASADIDYTSFSGTLTIPAGSMTRTIDISITDDAIDEPDETLQVTLSSPTNAVLGAQNSTTLTIADNDVSPGIEFSAISYAAAESDSTASISVVLSNVSGTAVSVDYATVDQSATAGLDYTATTGTLNIPSGQTMASFTVTLLGDSMYEGSEIISLALSNPSGAILGVSNAELTIDDDDAPPSVNVDQTSRTVNESIATYSVGITLSAAAGIDLVLPYAGQSVVARSGEDFSVNGSELTIPAGQISADIEVSIHADTLHETDETFEVVLLTPLVATLGSDTTETFTITDDDAAPSLQFNAAASLIDENAGPASVRIELTTLSGRDTTVEVNSSDVTASAGADYAAVSETITILEGEAFVDLPVEILDDLLIEVDETFILTMSSPTGATLGTASVHTVSIIEDELPPNVSLALTSQSVNEDVGHVSIEVVLSAVSTLDVDIDYATTAGSADENTDYSAANGTLTIPAGQDRGTIDVTIVDDNEVEDSEDFELTLSNPMNAAEGSDLTIEVTIVNDDLPTLDVVAATSSASESASLLSVELALDTAGFLPISFDVATSDGSALESVDYTAASDSYSLQPGETSVTLNIPLLDDAIDEADETITLTISNEVGLNLSAESFTLTIVDDEVPQLSFALASSTVSETVGTHSVEVVLDIPAHADTSVDVATVPVSADSGADFTAISQTYVLPSGTTSMQIDVELVDDVFIESDEAFDLALVNPSIGIAVASPSTHSVTLTSEDIVPTITLDSDATSIAEAIGAVDINIRLSEPFNQLVTLDYSTVDGSARAPDDFTAINGSISFSPGETLATLSLSVFDDGIAETSEAFLLRLENPGNALLGAPSSTTFTITDDDSLPPAAAPQIISVNILDPDDVYVAGDTISLEIQLDASSHLASADFGEVDSALSNALSATFFGSNRYRVTTPALSAATLLPGLRRAIQVVAENNDGQRVGAQISVTVLGDPPSGRLLLDQPESAVATGPLTITLSFDEQIATRPQISITGLNDTPAVNAASMSGDSPGTAFIYVLDIPSNERGSGTITVANALDASGRNASIPTALNFDVVAGGIQLKANAGPDQTISRPGVVILDGSTSIGATSYSWQQESGPNTVSLQAADSVQASVELKTAGTYVFALEVSDGLLSANDVAEVFVANRAPIVDAGQDFYLDEVAVEESGNQRFAAIRLAATVFDENGDDVHLSWSLIDSPTNGNVALVDPLNLDTGIEVFGTLIVAGEYRFELRATDPSGNVGSDVVRMLVTSATVVPPSADAGLDRIVEVGELITLSGSNSKDPDATDPASPILSYDWSFTSRPAGSSAVLAGPNTETPGFTPDEEGRYLLQLIVTDPAGLVSAASQIRIDAIDSDGGNLPPRAVISLSHDDTNSNGSINVGEQVSLSAVNSEDANLDPLSYVWQQLAGPEPILFVDSSAETLSFSPVLSGNYRFQLSVSDGELDGFNATVSVIVADSGFTAPRAEARIAQTDDLDDDATVLFVPGVGVDNNSANPEINLDAGASSVSSGLVASYSWKQIAGAPARISRASSAQCAVIPLTSGVVSFELRVTDSNGVHATSILTFAINTYDPSGYPLGNTLPTSDGSALSPNAVDVSIGSGVVLEAQGFDANGQNLSFDWVQEAGPPLNVSTDVNGDISLSFPVDGFYRFALYSNDGRDRGLPSIVEVSVDSGTGGGGPISGGGGGGGGGCSLDASARSPALFFLMVIVLLTLFYRHRQQVHARE